MPVLDSQLRGQLERTVIAARDAAEEAAKIALERLAVNREQPYETLTADERELRRRLRAKQRQLGSFVRLVRECAYEYWHRMLFGRFLAENGLLIHPLMNVPVTLEECAELASEEGAANQWTLAERYAAVMLPQIFRPDDPLLQVVFAPEHQQGLEGLLAGLPLPIFAADDSIGWVYQFWQSKRKDEINASGVKIGADEIGPVTQLFTEHYMVQFLLHNTLGAWWTARHPGETPPDALEYLRRLEDGTPSAGSFPGWPETAKKLRILDPCCGSGHFLVTMLDLMVKFRMHEEGLSEAIAAEAVLCDNLFGLEIDQRCTQIAAFALAFAAWKRGGYRPLPEINVACSGTPVGARREEWLELANGDDRLRAGMGQLYDLFKQAPELGSLIDPGAGSEFSLFSAGYAELQPLLAKAMEREKVRQDDNLLVAGVAAQGVAKAAEILAENYWLIVTNVPYLSRSKQGDSLQKFCSSFYPAAKTDLATVFIDRCITLCKSNGTSALVTPQSWLFQVGYKRLRNKLLPSMQFNIFARLGARAFEAIPGEVVNVGLFILSRVTPSNSHCFSSIDVSESAGPTEKAHLLLVGEISAIDQGTQLSNMDARITGDDSIGPVLLGKYASSTQGIKTGDDNLFRRYFWELPELGASWRYFQSTVEKPMAFGGLEYVLYWIKEGRTLARFQGRSAWQHQGIAVSQMSNLPCALYVGGAFDSNMTAIIPRNSDHAKALWAYAVSGELSSAVRKIDKSIKPTNSAFVSIPFDITYWQKIADDAGALPEPYSNDPTQWLFKGDPTDTTEPLQVALLRLLGYRWPEQEGDGSLAPFIDEDGIACLPSVGGEQPAAERLRALLVATYGDAWTPTKHAELLTAVGYGGKTLDAWLSDGFFEQHCKLFHHRPFIWHIWDGRRDGFSALVNYHKLDARLLERVAYTYIAGDWIPRQQHGVNNNESGAEARLLAARQLLDKLKLILDGEAPYDIFVRWKAIDKQPIGWEPDLNDGVRLNIRPFKTAGVLRWKPYIKWAKDRGTDPESAPWYKLGLDLRYNEGAGARINDHHLTLAEKRAARERS